MLYMVDEDTDEFSVLYNDEEFVMPETPHFEKVSEDRNIRYGGEVFPLIEIEPRKPGDFEDADNLVLLPDELRGKRIPEMDKT